MTIDAELIAAAIESTDHRTVEFDGLLLHPRQAAAIARYLVEYFPDLDLHGKQEQ